jgi:hypothetical protein
MNSLWDISKIPLPVTEAIGTDSCEDEKKSWVKDALATPDPDNAYSEKHTWTNEDDTLASERVQNYVQLSMKRIKVTTRARDTKEYATSDSLSKQVVRRQQELRRDVEAIFLRTDQVSRADTGSGAGQEGRMGSLGTWISTAYDGGAGGSALGFNPDTGLTRAPTVGTPRDITETQVRTIASDVWKEGGDPSLFVSMPDVKNAFAQYLFTSSARVGTVMSDTGQSAGSVRAKGNIRIFESDDDVTLTLIGNRLMQPSDPGGTPYTAIYLLDPQYLSLAYVSGYRVEPLAKTGPQEDRQMMVDATLVVHTEKAHGMISDVKLQPAVTP